ncbi:MAG: glycoside hydrolase family 38 C-terminal domain-containing protein [Myxococcota bacterium]|nr:glycoside hydrolase family 38 C-terminal domain-containing protein [Myxococcota bacterium]
MRHRLVVVPHTHWDREWYRTHEEFRLRLVRLLDGLLDLLEGDPRFRHFTLDGQTIVVDDYLEVRPEAAERLAKLVREGRLLVGPWYVLPDEWLVSGEALVRNLRHGLSSAARLGASMRVGYVPDQFGHVGQLPQIFAGFGMQEAILWRGVGEDVDRTLFRWEAPDGTALLTVYLMRGYGNASGLPLEPGALAERLGAAAAALAPHSPIASLLLMNGSDHLEPEPGLPAALEAAAARLGAEVEISGLADFAARARREAPEELPRHRGELRSGLRAPLLEGCASARIPQKRADFHNDRLLTRYLEPLCTWLAELGGDPDRGVLDHAWRVALQNHPHDSICGCSVDAVHDEMDVRFSRVARIGETHLEQVVAELGARVHVPRRGFGPGAGEALLAWNPHAAGSDLLDGVLELDVPARLPALHLRGADGRRIPVSAERARAEEVLADYRLPARVAAGLLRGFPEEFMGLRPCALALRERRGELVAEVGLGERPPTGFVFATHRDDVCDELEAHGERPVSYRARRLPRVRLRAVDALPGHGLRTYRLARGRARVPASLGAERRPDGGVTIHNAVWTVEAAADGRVHCVHRPSGSRIEDALRIASEGDRGDEYNYDPVQGDVVVERPARARVTRLPGSDAHVALRVDARFEVPAGLSDDRAARSARKVSLPARITVRLFEGLDRVEVDVEVDNRARDHRLRLLVRAPFAAEAFEVESAFEVAARPIAPAADAFGSDRPAERPIGATPQRSFATLSGSGLALTVAGRGSSEVEALPEGEGSSAIAVTLLRAVGWLSRGDLGLRPGHAGPPLPTPGAQVPGPHRAELAFRLHPRGADTRTLEAHRFAAPPRLFLGGGERGPLADGSRLLELDDPRVVVSAVEPGAGGGALLRIWNESGEPRPATLRWAARPEASLQPVDLLGAPDPRADWEPAGAGALRIRLRPHQIATLGTVLPRR